MFSSTSRTLSLKLISAGMLAITALWFPAFASAAQNGTAVTNEFSALTKQEEEAKRKAAPKAAPPKAAPIKQAPARVAPRPAAPRQVAPRPATSRQVAPRPATPRQVAPRQAAPRVNQGSGAKIIAPVTPPPSVVRPNAGTPSVARKVFSPRGANSNAVRAANIRGVPARGAGRATIAGRNYSAWRSGYRIRRGGGWRTFVALGALGVLAIGASEYYPYAYIEVPEPYCDGRTADGCQLVWDEVETMEGDAIGQCVAYCPQQ